MNWKVIFQLSVFGLIMAFGTVSLIPEKTEPAFWLVIFVFCAWVIAKVCSAKYFLSGLMVGILNSVWITVVHLLFRQTYLANHPQMTSNIPASFSSHPGMFMLVTAPVFGVLFGIILGLFSLLASKILTRNK